MSKNQVKSICIAGGGSAGWSTAAHALRLFQDKNIKVTLVESPNIPIIGVGEATLLGFDKFLTEECNIPFDIWTKECDATIKLGTLFSNWYGDGLDVWSPFLVPIVLEKDKHFDLFDLSVKAELLKPDFYSSASAWWEISVEDQKIPSTAIIDGPAGPGQHGVAYNLDAIKLANFLSKWCNDKYPYLTHIKKDIDKPIVKDGNVDHLLLKDGSTIHADLFLDCTGFRKILSNALEDPDWQDPSNMLFVNSAVASQINYKNNDDPQHPYVDATAHDLGWIWKTPIKDRIGSGLCYNNTITTKQEAEDAFVQYWGEDRLRTDEFNHINFTPGYNAKNWRGNVIPIGLSSGFVEPLESSGLALMTISMAPLAEYIVNGEYTKEDRDSYNERLAFVYENTIDFIGLHYFNNPRTGPFWKLVEQKYDSTQSLYDHVKKFKLTATHTRNEQYYPRDNGLYHEYNWKLWAYASGIGVKTHDMDKDVALSHISSIKDRDNKESYPGITNREWSHR
tara:strand:+ start:657 stop:2177 length:1521 start_codon:yes stop_codon:yes gene_type:complete